MPGGFSNRLIFQKGKASILALVMGLLSFTSFIGYQNVYVPWMEHKRMVWSEEYSNFLYECTKDDIQD